MKTEIQLFRKPSNYGIMRIVVDLEAVFVYDGYRVK